MKINPFLLCDGYKVAHVKMYPEGTTLVYSNFTPRSGRHAHPGSKGVVSFGQQMVMQQIHEMFQFNFFNLNKGAVCGEIKSEYELYLWLK